MEKQSHTYLESACMATFTCPRGRQGVHALDTEMGNLAFLLLPALDVSVPLSGCF